MFIEEIIGSPSYVEGRKFVERTIKSKFKRGEVAITTTYMDNKPLVKRYSFSGDERMKNVWKLADKKSSHGGKLDITV